MRPHTLRQSGRRPLALALLLVLTAGLMACQAPPPPTPEAEALRREINLTLQRLRKPLAAALAQRDIPALDAILKEASGSVPGLCLDCPYRLAVLDEAAILLTTYPKHDVVGLNFSSFARLLENMRRQRISQRQVYLPDRSKLYFISAPLVYDRRLVGAVVLSLRPTDLETKWRLTEKEFLAIDFNASERH